MSKKCQGYCNRMWDEYYVVGSKILCAQCWEKELDDLRYKLREVDNEERQKTTEANRMTQQMEIEYRKMHQQHDMKYNDISRQVKNLEDEIRIKTQNREWYEYESEDSYNIPRPYNYEEVQILRNRMWKLKEEEKNRYRTNPTLPRLNFQAGSSTSFSKRSSIQNNLNQLKNAKYYTPSEAKAEEQAERDALKQKRKEEEQKQKEKEQKTIIEAEELLEKAKISTQKVRLKKVKDKIIEIETLIQTGIYSNAVKAIELLTKNYDWKLNAKEIFSASLSDFNNQKVLFENKRMEAIQESITLLTCIKVKKDKSKQTTDEINKIKELIEKETYADSTESIYLLKKNYSWKTTSGKPFNASLLEFDSKLVQCEEAEKQEKKRIQDLERIAEQRRNEEEKRKREEAERIAKQKIEEPKRTAELNANKHGCFFQLFAIIFCLLCFMGAGLGIVAGICEGNNNYLIAGIIAGVILIVIYINAE